MDQNIVIAAPDDVLRIGLYAIFTEDPRVAAVHEVATNDALIRHLKLSSVDLVVVDQTLETDFTILPRGDFVILATEPNIHVLQASYQSGARGYLSVHTSKDLLRMTLDPPQGSFLLDPLLTPWLMRYFACATFVDPEEAFLTEREKQVDRLTREGLDKHTIAEQLSIAYSTVKTHVKHIAQKRSKNKQISKSLLE